VHITVTTARPARLSLRAGPLPAVRSLLTAVAVAAGLDAAFAFVGYVLVDDRYDFESLLQYIASGLFGRAAFTGGASGFDYAAAGFAIHAVLATGFTIAYAVVVAPRVHRHVVTAGLVYGAAIWVFMNSVVLPQGRSSQEAFGNGWYLAFLADHAVFVGLPIALILAGGRVRDVEEGVAS
jgi:hypothetical protein